MSSDDEGSAVVVEDANKKEDEEHVDGTRNDAEKNMVTIREASTSFTSQVPAASPPQKKEAPGEATTNSMETPSPKAAAAAAAAAAETSDDNNDDDDDDDEEQNGRPLPPSLLIDTPGLTPLKKQQKKLYHSSDEEDENARHYTSFSECLYGVPADDELWEGFFAQPEDELLLVQDDDDEDDEDDDKGTGAAWIWKRQARVRGHRVPLSQLRRLAARGIPDEGSHRGVVWRLLLGPSLPPDNIDHWQAALQQQRSHYHALCRRWFGSSAGADGTATACCWDDWNYGHALRVHRKQEHAQRMMEEADKANQTIVLQLETDDEYQSLCVTATATPTTTGGDTAGTTTDDDDEEEETPPVDDDDARIRRRQGRKPFKRTRPDATSLLFYDNPNVLDHLPEPVKHAWTVERGKDLHILKSLMKSFNAPRLPRLDEDGTDNDNDSGLSIDEFCNAAILLDEIRKDVVRTHADLSFFLDPHDDLGRRRYAALERILFLWVQTTTPALRYVQGMNEIVGALYYVLANDARTEWATHAEADSFTLFTALLQQPDVRDVFCAELDAVDTGMRGRISALQDLLERHDPDLARHFSDIGLDASFYAVRWLSTLLSREFLLPDTIRLWDSMLASTHVDNFLKYVCVTMLLAIRQPLLQGDFATCIQLLQQYPPPRNMDALLDASRALYIYEWQITVACHQMPDLSPHAALLSIPPPPHIIRAFGFDKGIPPPLPPPPAATRVTSAARQFYQRVFSAPRPRRQRSPTKARNKSERPRRQEAATSSPVRQLSLPPETPTRQAKNNDAPAESATASSPDVYMKAILGSSPSPPAATSAAP